MIYYHDHPEYRIGDEINSTALIKYFKAKGCNFYYKDANSFISAMKLFPDDLVIFCSENLYEYHYFEPWNLWFWNFLLKQKGFYTELNVKYEKCKADIDLLFIPVLETGYNQGREVNPDSAYELFLSLKRNHNIKMVIDKNKQQILNIDDSDVIYSNDIYYTFDLIKRSKIFIGSDTGTSHYAGALKHPKMILISPSQEYNQMLHNKFAWHREIIYNEFKDPEILNAHYDGFPCCDPNQFKVSFMNYNSINIPDVMNLVKSIQ